MRETTYSNNSYVVKVGDTVTYELDGEVETYTILEQVIEWVPISVGGSYGNPAHRVVDKTGADLNKGTIHEKAPVVQSMLGKRIGESFSYIVDGIPLSGKILAINSKTIMQTINRLSYTHFASGLWNGNLRIFTIVVHREKGIAVKMEGLVETKIIDIEPYNKAKLQSIFEQLAKIQLPTQHTFTFNATDGDSWLLNIDDIEYRGYFTNPKFLKDILSIIDYNSLYEKYSIAFERYINAK